MSSTLLRISGRAARVASWRSLSGKLRRYSKLEHVLQNVGLHNPKGKQFVTPHVEKHYFPKARKKQLAHMSRQSSVTNH